MDDVVVTPEGEKAGLGPCQQPTYQILYVRGQSNSFIICPASKYKLWDDQTDLYEIMSHVKQQS